MKDSTFNRWFNVFILSGMSVALIIITSLKLGGAQTGRTLLVISAFGSLMGVLSTVCSANARILTFLFGLLDVSIYGVMCLINWRNGSSGLGNAMLHFLYFVPMQFVGFAQWKKKGAGGGRKVKARRLNGRQWLAYSALFAAGTVASYFIIAHFDRSASDSFIKTAVVLDVLPLMCNIIGQMLMSMAYAEQWYFWIGVNVTSIVMWSVALSANPSDSYTLVYVIKYSFYLLNSFNGLRIWMNLSKTDH